MPSPQKSTGEKTSQEVKTDSNERGSREHKKENENKKRRKVTDQILLVEDEPLLGNLLERRLDEEGFEILRAEDGQEALEKVKNNELDLILLDIILPKISGFEFLKKIREAPQVGDIPVVIISNLGQESDIKKGKELGAVGYFVKAELSIEGLVSQVKEFLNNR
ncbi:MAG: response regulator [Candidatus Magasanikbacteria bacterium]